jgi:hypothetical protein
MRGSLFGIAGFALIVAYPAVLAADKQHDYSNINCADKDFLVA